MPRKPLPASLLLALVTLTATACSSGSDSPTGADDTSTSTTTSKLQRETGKGGSIKNVFAKTPSGGKISLYAAAPGHEIMQQVYDATAKTWSKPTSVFADDKRFCHSVKLKAQGSVFAATVACSISAQDANGTQSSFVLVSTDAKTWKRSDLDGASGKPSIAPNGKYVSWSSPTAFLLWSTTGDFVTAEYAQSQDAPTVGVTQDDGSVLLITAAETKNKTCTISFKTISAKAPVPKTVNSTLPQPDHPKCKATTAKMQDSDVIANFQSTSAETNPDGKKVQKTTTFAYAFRKLATGKWIIKS